MELGALVCTPRNPQCQLCPVKRLCIAFRTNRVEELPNLGKRETVTRRHFAAFVIQRDGKFLVRQRPAGVVNAHLWEFPNVEIGARLSEPQHGPRFKSSSEASASALARMLRVGDPRSIKLSPLATVKHSITRYRITLEAFHAVLGGRSDASPHSKQAKSGTRVTRPSEHPSEIGLWKTPAQMRRLAFSSAHKKILNQLNSPIVPGATPVPSHKKLATLAENRILSGP